MSIFGTSGIRQLFSKDLIELGFEVGIAVGSEYQNVVVGHDTRTSSSALTHSIIAGLLVAGARASDAGIVPTPTLAYAANEYDCGIMVTASHNPPQYNGIKLLNSDGSAFSVAQQTNIENIIGGQSATNVAWHKLHYSDYYRKAVEKHIDRIKKDFLGKLNLKIVVDCGCGAAYMITPLLLTQLGCDVISLNCSPNGIFPHDVEPLEANLGELMTTVKTSGADLGIAHDGDADRMMAIDERGRFIPGDKMLAILANSLASRRVVTTVDASMAIDELKFIVLRTKVGDPYISEQLKNGGEFGGEPSGAWVFPRVSLCPDGIYAAASIANVASHQRLSTLADDIQTYPIFRGSISGKINSVEKLKQMLIASLKPANFDSVDGIKLRFQDSWLLIRLSGTEPKVRLTVEAKDERMARELYENGVRIVSEHIKTGEL